MRRIPPIILASAALLAVNACALDQNLAPSLQKKFDKKITLDLRDMDIIDVYKFLSMKGDFSIVVSKTVTGRVTLVLKSVKVGDALDIISIANGLGYYAIEEIVYVMPEQEYFQMFGSYFRDKTKVDIVHLNYVKPSYALEALKNIKSEIGKIVIDEETGTIVLVDIEDKLRKMKEVLASIDRGLETKIFPLNYAKAAVVKEKLRERLDVKAVGSIEADERSNQVVITALPERFKEIETLVKAFDKKTKEVLIKVKILKLSLKPKYDFGINWEATLQKAESAAFRSLHMYGAFPVSTTISAGTEYAKIMMGDVDDDAFEFAIMALKQVSDTKTLANPTILVTNEEEARIHIGDKLAYVTTTTIGTGADQTTNEEVHFIDVGIIMSVKPFISDDNTIRMQIKPEISSKYDDYETPAGAEIPLVNTTTVETNVMIKDGTTIVIGGLNRDETQSTKKGLPYLMDLPVVGNVFQSISDEHTRTEIVIILTPHILDNTKTYVGYNPTMAPIKQY